MVLKLRHTSEATGGVLLQHRLLGPAPRVSGFFPNEFPGAATAAGLRTTPWEPLLQGFHKVYLFFLPKTMGICWNFHQ